MIELERPELLSKAALITLMLFASLTGTVRVLFWYVLRILIARRR